MLRQTVVKEHAHNFLINAMGRFSFAALIVRAVFLCSKPRKKVNQ